MKSNNAVLVMKREERKRKKDRLREGFWLRVKRLLVESSTTVGVHIGRQHGEGKRSHCCVKTTRVKVRQKRTKE